MTLDMWFLASFLCGCFLGLEAILYLTRNRKNKTAQEYLDKAKREVHAMSQIPLHNPHPMVHLSLSGEMLFANLAALKSFPDIQDKKFQHELLHGLETITVLDEITTREVNYQEQTYFQTVKRMYLQGEETLIVYFYDVSERKAYERDLEKARKEAEKARLLADKANQARGDFLANMSHELRTPMNGIIGLSEVALETKLDAEQREMIGAVNTSAKNLLILLNDILDFSKIEAGELTIEEIPYDFRRIIQSLIPLHASVCEQKSITLKHEICDDMPEAVLGDPTRLQQILNNLLSNAVKFTDKGHVSLSIKTKLTRDIVNIQMNVSDTGVGISKDKQATIFQKFQQADSSTTRQFGGTGLGLTITKELVERMGGKINLESELGKGTTFSVSLQSKIVPREILNTMASKEQKFLEPMRSDMRLLVADDHPVNLLFIRKMMSKLGIKHFDEAKSGEEALELFGQHKYDAILMDCQMPNMDGYEATRKIREKDKEIPIIALTADAMKGAQEKCRAVGMNAYISKPIDIQKLQTVLNNFLGPNISSQDRLIPENENKEDIFNVERFEKFTEGDQDLEKEIIEIFLSNMSIDIKELETTFAQKDFKKWAHVAHKIYGAACHIGAQKLANLTEEAQDLNIQNQELVAKTHQTICDEVTNFKNYLGSFYKEKTGT